MRKKKVSYIELVRKNKEELLKDRDQIEMIEKRIDAKHEKVNAK
ncbi:Fur-regulated basic protein B [Cytobacillus horneckiae]|uniref:FbpB family small basic protein n=1 Tax=Cytobacillus horneckiae TaxID=549687 RepID=A0A2N0Z8M9_9BACI|nr:MULTISPECIES: FbpB family small basic protein [Bacillota]NRG44167.1 FbpB family small basic protein [Bacillus sp. CRN 9]MBN6886264.1 FbpB family small basic protein [Cytobacillus horneckiae]MCM3176504.1 FbpB family small basic protein [Cytobacillus horneckiae]MDC7292785.1 FbpB family small basic protein [Butyrivibrio sp. DSM 10294]MEC1157679.1 FbpB family small basic protein [Cytobacillus horneckiae]